MADETEDVNPQLAKFQIGCSWIPMTPTKANLPNSRIDDINLTGNNSVQANWPKTESLTSDNSASAANLSVPDKMTGTFPNDIVCQTSDSENLPELGKGFNNWPVDDVTKNHIHDENVQNFNTWQSGEATKDTDKLSFTELLAQAGKCTAQVDIAVYRNYFEATTGCTYAPWLQPHMQGTQFINSFGGSTSSQGIDGLREVERDKIQHILTDGSSSSSRPLFDLNMVPKTNVDASPSKNAGSQIEPITPEKSTKAVYQLSESASMQLQENHKPDKGSIEEADLSKTPQKKPRRSKHRPKVITEGKPRINRKQNVESSGTTQETTTGKRKPGRPKKYNNSPGTTLESDNNQTDMRDNTPCSVGTAEPKWTYVRIKKMNKPKDTEVNADTESLEANFVRQTRSSCRRSLNFDLEGQVNGESPSNNQPLKKSETEILMAEDQSRTGHYKSGMENMKAKGGTIMGNELTAMENFLARHTQYDPNSSSHSDMNSLPSYRQLMDDGPYSRGKRQLVYSGVSLGEETDNIQATIDTYNHLAANCSSTCFGTEREVQGTKRQHTDAPVEPEFCNSNAMGMFYNSPKLYAGSYNHIAGEIGNAPGLHFPATHKRKRTEKRHNVVTFSLPYNATTSYNLEILEKNRLGASSTKPCTSTTNQGPLSTQCNLLTTDCASNATKDGWKVLSDMVVTGTTEKIKRKRTKDPTRVRDLASLHDIGKGVSTYPGALATTSQVEHKAEILHEQHTCMRALLAYNSLVNSTPITKKRSKRRVGSTVFVQNYDFATQSMGPPLSITWKRPSFVDSIIEKLSQLDLNAEISEESARNLSTAYNMHYQEHYALVPYQSHGAIVPFESSLDQARRRRPRAKVDLDDETTRVWKLLLENINSEGIDGTDEEKAKWWEEERRVFRGRADSFIARMHLVQGDRRFSPWKGSVVDSVVGVFLTQNVSDHLSSSAFMSLVEKFPAQSTNHLSGGTKVQEPDSCMAGPSTTFESNIQIQDNSLCCEESIVLQEFRNDEVREVNSNTPSVNSSEGSIPKHNLMGQSPDTFKHVPVVFHETNTNKPNSPISDGRYKKDAVSSQTLEISSQSSADSPTAHTAEISESCLGSTSEEPTAGNQSNMFMASSTSFVKLLHEAGTVQHGVYETQTDVEKSGQVQSRSSGPNLQNDDYLENTLPSAKRTPLDSESTLSHSPYSEALAVADLSQESGKLFYSTLENKNCVAATCRLVSESASQTTAASFADRPQFSSPNFDSSTNVHVGIDKLVGDITGHTSAEVFMVQNHSEKQEVSDTPICSQNSKDVMGSSSKADYMKMSEFKEDNSSKSDVDYSPRGESNNDKAKGARTAKEKNKTVDWDHLRQQAKKGGKQRGKTSNTMDSVDWDTVRCANVNEIADAIKERGMNNVLAARIKDFLNRLVRDHESIDLEWLRDVPPDKAKEYLLSIRGLGLKSVECVRLLTLHHLAFPVDTNVGRIAVRLGWVPLQPLPESLQLHLLELYPMLESIQMYLWPRLCKLDQKTLYELHYQMITFGKVFCTKSKPNCNACPMRAECRHFASAFASARLALPATEEKGIVISNEDRTTDQNQHRYEFDNHINPLQLPSNQTDAEFIVSNSQPIIEVPPSPEHSVEEDPVTPGEGDFQIPDIEEFCREDPDEIPTIKLNMEEFTHNLQTIMQHQNGDMSKALVALSAEAASIPVPKLKNMNRLRTEHLVYELPEEHPLLEGLDKREPDDPCPYMLAIWSPGETVNSTEPPKRKCSSQESEKLCNDETCSSCNSIREATSETVRGTLLIPCRTAMRGSFPLNGTYFQVNEVFADHASSLSPMDVPRRWLWNLSRRTVYFGTSIPTIFRGLSTEGIQYCFWRGFVCVRGFERETRAPRPLIARLHFPASKMTNKGKGKVDE